MRDWKVFRPDSGGSGASSVSPPRPVSKRRSVVDPEVDDPQFEIALDMDSEQLTLMFDEAMKDDRRSRYGPLDPGAHYQADYQEEWRREALRAKADIAETFGPWTDESRVEGATYFRKATRLS